MTRGETHPSHPNWDKGTSTKINRQKKTKHTIDSAGSTDAQSKRTADSSTSYETTRKTMQDTAGYGTACTQGRCLQSRKRRAGDEMKRVKKGKARPDGTTVYLFARVGVDGPVPPSAMCGIPRSTVEQLPMDEAGSSLP